MWGEEVPSLRCAPAQRQAWRRAGPTASNVMRVVETSSPRPVPRPPHFFRKASFGTASLYPTCWELCEEGWPGCTSPGWELGRG